jgi:legumain
MISILITLLSLLSTIVSADNWAVLFAGSSSYGNYRHQSDIMHAYHTLIDHGFDHNKIITFVFDDIASDPDNPYPGQVFNRPSKGKGFDVYKNFKKSYTGNNVNSTNLFNVLKGNFNAMKGIGSGEVLNSTSNDNVFFAYADHGGAFQIETPVDAIYADDLNTTFTYMYENKMYNKMVVYIEACESGSMFDGILSPNISIYATTAANPDQSSYGWFCPGGVTPADPGSIVDGIDLETCLGDLYTISWLENTDWANSTETLQQQYLIVKNETIMSQVMQYGDTSFTNMTIWSFMGNLQKPNYSINNMKNDYIYENTINSRDATFYSLVNIWFKQNVDSERFSILSDKIINELQNRKTWKSTIESITNNSIVNSNMINFKCYKNVDSNLEYTLCGKYSDWSLQYSKVIAELCNKIDEYSIINQFIKKCKESNIIAKNTIIYNDIINLKITSINAYDAFNKLINLV